MNLQDYELQVLKEQMQNIKQERRAAMLDPHKLKAAECFNVPYDEVTSQQRQYAKVLNYAQNYSFRSPDALFSGFDTTKREGLNHHHIYCQTLSEDNE
jgi:hypothetical protein